MTITFSKSDLYIVKYDQRLESLIKRIVSPDLLSCIFDWLKHVELRPINYTEALSFYQQLDRQGQIKTTLIERIHIDWVIDKLFFIYLCSKKKLTLIIIIIIIISLMD